MATHAGILAWEMHGQRSLADSGPWGRSEGNRADTYAHNQGNVVLAQDRK